MSLHSPHLKFCDDLSINANALPYAHGLPPVRGHLRTIPEDFYVREELDFSLDGTGEHIWLWVRKRGANTEWVAKRLAERAGVAPGAVSYAGLKDRRAVAEQWFSVHWPHRTEPDWAAGDESDFTVLKAVRHSRKLRRGALSGNAFRIVIRELDGNLNELTTRLNQIVAHGVPHYFGEQRFGHEGSNLERAKAVLSGREKVRDRYRRGLYLSAARAELFNRVLAQRVWDQTWNQALPGEVFMLAGSHSIFAAPEIDDALCQRVTALDIHPTGPLWGAGELRSGGVVRALEEAIAAIVPVFRDGLAAVGLSQERRALRLVTQDAALQFLTSDAVEVSFRLPAGGYATTVLRELVETPEP